MEKERKRKKKEPKDVPWEHKDVIINPFVWFQFTIFYFGNQIRYINAILVAYSHSQFDASQMKWDPNMINKYPPNEQAIFHNILYWGISCAWLLYLLRVANSYVHCIDRTAIASEAKSE